MGQWWLIWLENRQRERRRRPATPAHEYVWALIVIAEISSRTVCSCRIATRSQQHHCTTGALFSHCIPFQVITFTFSFPRHPRYIIEFYKERKHVPSFKNKIKKTCFLFLKTSTRLLSYIATLFGGRKIEEREEKRRWIKFFLFDFGSPLILKKFKEILKYWLK